MIEDVMGLEPWPSFAPHCAAKAAQAMLTRVLVVTMVWVLAGAPAVGRGAGHQRANEVDLLSGALDRGARR